MDAIHNKWRKCRSTVKSKKKMDVLRRLREENRKRMTGKKRSVVDNSRSEISTLDDSSGVQCTSELLLIHTSFFDNIFKDFQCPECLSKCINSCISERHGLCVKIKVFCTNCDHVVSEQYTSPRLDSTTKRQAAFSVNRKAVDSILNIGLGNAAFEKFCANMSIKPMSLKTFHHHQKAICEEAVKLEEKVLSEACAAVREAHLNQDSSLTKSDVIDIACSYDGTWHKRGHTSMYGIGIAIDILTGLVIDFEILSKFCHSCICASSLMGEESPEFSSWLKEHQESHACMKNFSGSSGSMEVCAAERIWIRSEKKNRFRYTTVLSDGDARTWTRLNEIQPYGASVRIEKEECVNHVHKRMGKGLREAAQENSLGGKKEGALTAQKIEALTKYYRRAIVNSCGDTEATQEAIKATLYHCSSSDIKPQHHLCPKGTDSWCFYNKAVALNEKPASHKNMRVRLSGNVMKCLLPLYEKLSDTELINRCSRGATQNFNESLHSLIWRRCSKEIFVSRQRIHLAVVNAVMEKNLGILKSQKLKLSIRRDRMSTVGQEVFTKLDTMREKRKRSQEDYRHSRRLEKLENARKKTPEHSKDYSPGAFH